MQEHIAKSFDKDLKSLNEAVADMGATALKMVSKSLLATKNQDFKAAKATIEKDDEVDEQEREISISAVKMIAMRQPMAVDLRSIVVSIRIAADLERIADCAVNVARRIISGEDFTSRTPVLIRRLLQLGGNIETLIKKALRLIKNPDEKGIIELWKSDIEIDETYVSIFREGVSHMVEDPRSISGVMMLIFLAKDLERMGDHITNIAETLHFKESGELLAIHRPKGKFGDVESLTLKRRIVK